VAIFLAVGQEARKTHGSLVAEHRCYILTKHGKMAVCGDLEGRPHHCRLIGGVLGKWNIRKVF